MLIDLFAIGAVVILLFDFVVWTIKQASPTYQPKHGRRRFE